jgi:D-glycero-alpha-D-manno-heptose-7-phosphate kinase
MIRVVIIESSAPTRIDLAGGTLDIWPLYLFHEGAQTLNTAISLRARTRIELRSDGIFAFRSLDTNRQLELPAGADLRASGDLKLLTLLSHAFLSGGRGANLAASGFTMTTDCASPAGAGIAGSSALAVATGAALARAAGEEIDGEVLLEIVKNVECQTINVPTGLQDYRPALYGGTAAVELRVDGPRRVSLPVPAKELERRIVLCYTGAPRNSGTNNWEITRRHLDGDRFIFDCFERIRDTAVAMRAALARGDWDAVAAALRDEWANRTRLAPGVTTPAIDTLLGVAGKAGATAGKVCGAGGGGCLFCLTPPDRRAAVAAALEAGGARVLPFTIETEGLQWQ